MNTNCHFVSLEHGHGVILSFSKKKYSLAEGFYIRMIYRESVAGSVIQATGKVEFEDGLWIGNHLKA